MLPRATEEPNQEAADREEKNQKCPQHHDEGRAATATHFAHSNHVRDDQQNKEQEGPEGIIGHGLGGSRGLCCCVA